MSQFNDSGYKAFVAGGALAANLRVKIVAGVLALAGVADLELGTMRDDAFAAGEVHTVILRNKQGTAKMVAAAAIAQDAVVYTAANGQISTTSSGGAIAIGIALEAATATNDTIEVCRY